MLNPQPLGIGTHTRRVIVEARERLAEAGLRGSFLVRNLDTGLELGIDPDITFPVASLVKVPLALTVLEQIRTGQVNPGTTMELLPENGTPGPTGLCNFSYPARIAVIDLLFLAIAVSDDTAADALFALCPPDMVDQQMKGMHISGLRIRHTIHDLYLTLAERLAPHEAHLAQALAIQAGTSGGGHLIPQLDVSHANSGSARDFVQLLDQIWSNAPSPESSAEVRRMMGANLLRHRLAPDFATGSSRWSSKTGTFLNLRHEVGVVEHADGTRFAVAALTESSVPVTAQPSAEQTIGYVARMLHDTLRN